VLCQQPRQQGSFTFTILIAGMEQEHEPEATLQMSFSPPIQ